MKLIKSVSVILGLMISFTALAWNEEDDMNTTLNSYINCYFGANYQYAVIRPYADWNRLLVKKYPGFSVFLGARFHPCFGAELGYKWTANRYKRTTINNGNSFLNILNTTGENVTIIANNRVQSAFLDFIAFIPFDFNCQRNPEALISVGVANTHLKLKMNTTPVAFPFSNQFSAVQSKTQAVGRLGLGIQSLFIENVGFRFMWRWEGTQTLRAKNGVAANSATRFIYHDACSLSLGVFVEV